MKRSRPPGHGFTLIETLMVVGLLGIIMVVLAATFSVIVRTQPPSEARSDDSRTTLGLTTYLPEDVNSTPPTGFDRPSTRAAAAAQPIGCTGTSTTGLSLLKLTWTESVGATTTYVANYRVIADGSGSRLVRYHCVNGGTASVVRMTSRLPAVPSGWEPGEAPVNFTIVGMNGVDVEITTESGDVVTLQARSNNPADTLPPDPPQVFPPIPSGNVRPTAQDVVTTTPVATPVTVALPVADPDVGDALTIVPSNPTVSASTAGWTATLSGFNLTVTPPLGAPEGEVATVTYQARDPYGQLSLPESTVSVTLVAAPVNTPPTAGDVSGTVVAGTQLLINLPIADADGDPLTITIGTHGDGITATVDQATRIMTVVSDGSDETPASFTYTVNDGRGGVATGTVNLVVQICKVQSLSPMATSVPRQNGNHRLQSSVTYTVAYTGPCTDLVLVFDHDGNSTNEVLSFASGTNVVVQGHPGGLSNWTLGGHNMYLRNGVSSPNLVTAVLTVT